MVFIINGSTSSKLFFKKKEIVHLRIKLSGPATSNNEGNYAPLFYVENTKISVYVESPHKFNI